MMCHASRASWAGVLRSRTDLGRYENGVLAGDANNGAGMGEVCVWCARWPGTAVVVYYDAWMAGAGIQLRALYLVSYTVRAHSKVN